LSWVDSVSAGVARWSSGGSPGGPLIVTYHGLGGSDGVSPSEFEAHLELLMARRKVRPLAETVSCLGKPGIGELASITFDDGYRDYVEIAVPILERLGLQATLFVPAGMIGKSNEWDHGILSERRILDAGELRDLDPTRTELGSHGYSHCRMRGLSREQLRREVDEARSILSEISGRPVRLLAYPYGQADDFDDATVEAVERAGFIAACSTRFGRGSGPDERFRLCRVGIEAGDTMEIVANKFDGAYDWTAWKERAGAMLRRVGLRR
jgi:peptidoglycan/xylan/chitin deacetylase (PgdA/CDA1 family)